MLCQIDFFIAVVYLFLVLCLECHKIKILNQILGYFRVSGWIVVFNPVYKDCVGEENPWTFL